MKIIGLEEHFVTPGIVDAWRRLDGYEHDVATGQLTPEIENKLLDLGEGRFAEMDAAGIDMQILSVTTPGVQNLGPADAVALATEANDTAAEAVRAHPDRLQGFATLPTPDPEAAARELERAVTKLGLDGAMVNGRTRERPLSDPAFLPILEAAAALRAPIHLHPQYPLPPVHDTYYAGIGRQVDQLFAGPGIGWHYETGVQLLRLILSGVFDRLPDLQVIAGHWGEAVLFYLDRLDMMGEAAKLARPIHEYFQHNVFVAGSGIWSQRYLQWALEVLGPDRILFSADYPYIPAPNGAARAFLDDAAIPDATRQAIAHGNWERLRAGIRR